MNSRTVSPADIAFVIMDLHAGGTQRVVSTIANALHHSGRQVCIITLAEPQTDFFSLAAGVRRIAIGRYARAQNRISGMFAARARVRVLRHALADAGAPVVVSFLPFINILTVLASAWSGRRVVLCERNDPARQRLPFPWGHLRRLLYRYAEVVTANSRAALEQLRGFVPGEKLAYLPNPLAIPNCIPVLEKKALTVLAVGRLHPQKAYDVLLKAFSMVAPENPDWRLAFVGDGALRDELQRLAAGLGIADRVDWHGRVKDPFPFYRAADIFVLPSRYEGTPNALLEAFGCGLPAIVSDSSPGPLEYVVHGQNGLVVPVGDVQALADALQRLMAAPELRRQFAAAGTRLLAEHSIEHVLGQFDRIVFAS